MFLAEVGSITVLPILSVASVTPQRDMGTVTCLIGAKFRHFSGNQSEFQQTWTFDFLTLSGTGRPYNSRVGDSYTLPIRWTGILVRSAVV